MECCFLGSCSRGGGSKKVKKFLCIFTQKKQKCGNMTASPPSVWKIPLIEPFPRRIKKYAHVWKYRDLTAPTLTVCTCAPSEWCRYLRLERAVWQVCQSGLQPTCTDCQSIQLKLLGFSPNKNYTLSFPPPPWPWSTRRLSLAPAEERQAMLERTMTMWGDIRAGSIT